MLTHQRRYAADITIISVASSSDPNQWLELVMIFGKLFNVSDVLF